MAGIVVSWDRLPAHDATGWIDDDRRGEMTTNDNPQHSIDNTITGLELFP